VELRTFKLPAAALALLSLTACGIISGPTRPKFAPYRYDEYLAKEGDSLEKISDYFGVPVGVLAVINGETISAGEHLKVPFLTELYPLFRHPTAEAPEAALPIIRYYRGRVMWPVLGGIVSSWFGMRDGREHHGVDIKGPIGAYVFASHRGKIVYAGKRKTGYGKTVIIEGRGFSTLYAHLSEIYVSKGETVQIGAPIALVGMTGNATGPHLHFEAAVNGERFDAINLFAPEKVRNGGVRDTRRSYVN
jgi:murein DD-endopeptidase MepM/ murein hydrolase activator NlpD